MGRTASGEIQTFRSKVQAEKRGTTLEGLFRLSRLLNETALERLRRRTGSDAIRATHTALLPHIALEGTRPTVLAERVGVTKQAVGQLLDELESLGLVERVPDPEDGRAKLVRFSSKGRASILAGLSLLRELEAELCAALGAKRWVAFRSAVFDLSVLSETLAVGERLEIRVDRRAGRTAKRSSRATAERSRPLRTRRDAGP